MQQSYDQQFFSTEQEYILNPGHTIGALESSWSFLSFVKLRKVFNYIVDNISHLTQLQKNKIGINSENFVETFSY